MSLDELADRIRAELQDVPFREQRAFGGLAFMVNDAMTVSVRKGGNLLVRVDPARTDELLDRPGASPARMGTRVMSTGWIEVDAAELSSEALSVWVGLALEHNARPTA